MLLHAAFLLLISADISYHYATLMIFRADTDITLITL